MKIKVKRIRNVELPEQLHEGEWYDLHCPENILCENYDYIEIPLGIAVELPKGYEAHVIPRSSTFKKYGIILVNGMGIIDNAYCGDNDEWKFPVYCTRDSFIDRGDRIGQFRIVKTMKDTEIVEVDYLGNKDRKGIGSTGK